jgi:WD40 repeat protein
LNNNIGKNLLDKTKSKNRSSVLLPIGIFVAVLILMFLARMRSQNVRRISIPLNNGMVALLTYNNLLGAVSNDNKVYLWEWSGLSKTPREVAVESGEAVFAAPDAILSVKRTNPDYLVASGFDANSESKKIPLSLRSNAASLCANHDGSKIILLLQRGTDEYITYEVFEVEFNAKQVRLITTISAEQGKIEHSAVSDDGRYVVVAGGKKEQGWMFLVDTKENKMVWQKEFPNFKKVHKGVFSKDGDIIYLRGSDSMLTLVKTNSGEIIDRWLPIEENKSTYRVQPAQTVAISSDGGLVAATVVGNVYVWDTKTRKKYDVPGANQKVFSSIVFSPDAKFIATADMRQGGNIKVIQTPHN